MAKEAQRYLDCEPWRVVETGFHPQRNMAGESIFSIANEAMGLRGYAEEGTDAPCMIGSYFGGVYEEQPVVGQPGYKGIVRETHYMVCCADYLYIRLWQNGQRIQLTEAVCGFSRVLDMRSGLYSRGYTTQLPAGGTLTLTFERLVGMDDATVAGQRITLTADTDAALTLEMGVDAAVKHTMNGQCQWQQVDSVVGEKRGMLRMRTASTCQTIDYGFALDTDLQAEAMQSERRLLFRMNVQLRAGVPVVIGRRIRNTVCTAAMPALTSLDDAPGFERLLALNRAHYKAFWHAADVEIDGDNENQQGVRFCVFQLHQTYRGLDGRHNIGAKGLTGEAYNGHAFWDSETYCLPYYLLNDRHAARSLIAFRYHTLPQAMERAKMLDCKGACYPIATLNGKEACTLWQHASLQMHPATAVAYAIMEYARRTGDEAFLYHEGLEMLVQISRYLLSRGDWNSDHTGFGFYGVMGPDEFHMMVNNNFYTNFMGKKTLLDTLEVLDSAPEEAVDVSAAERALWREAAEKMILLRREDGVFEQHEGYFGLPHLDIHAIPLADFPLYDHWSYDRIYRTDMLKQPDVLMAMFLYPGDFTREEKLANYNYYEPRCIHESSLSPSIHAIIAQELDIDRAAADFFGFATRLDLDDYNRNTSEGLHLANIAAAWITVVYGFGGLRTIGGELSLAPRLPDGWQRYTFRFLVHESVVCAEVTEKGCTLRLVSGASVRVTLDGTPVEVTAR